MHKSRHKRCFCDRVFNLKLPGFLDNISQSLQSFLTIFFPEPFLEEKGGDLNIQKSSSKNQVEEEQEEEHGDDDHAEVPSFSSSSASSEFFRFSKNWEACSNIAACFVATREKQGFFFKKTKTKTKNKTNKQTKQKQINK